LTEHATGSKVTLTPGEMVEVALHGNAATGFGWEVAPGAETVLAQKGETGFIADHGVEGTGGTYTFTFQAVAPGEATLKLLYRRPREQAPLKEFTVQVTVTY
jgi:predicted secreted protein